MPLKGMGKQRKRPATKMADKKNPAHLPETVAKTPAPVAIAFDIGTTGIVGQVIAPSDKKDFEAKAHAAKNPLIKWGPDVLSRIKAIEEDPSLLGEMQAALAATINDIIERCTDKAEDISLITAAGNSVMEHILHGVSPLPLGRVPYKPVFKEGRMQKASDLGIDSAPNATLYTFPLVGGFIGGDTVAATLATGFNSFDKDKKDSPSILIDIGTNSEIVLRCDDSIFAASAAAGPAFEGGAVKFGMTAVPGAIEGVYVTDGSLKLKTIEGSAPKGICGSGIMDLVSVLLSEGVLNKSGRIKDPEEVENNIESSIKKEKHGNMVVLYRDASTMITFDQDDVRSLQVAKAAIRAGISVVLKKAGIVAEDVRRVFVAGAFGSSIKAASLARIGLIDPKWEGVVQSVGNASLRGATLAARSSVREAAEALASRIRYVSLSGSPAFEKEFIERMNFSEAGNNVST